MQCSTSKKLISIPCDYCNKSLKKHHCPYSKMFSPNLNWKINKYHSRVTNDKSSWFHTKLKKYQFIFYEDIFQKKLTKYKDDGLYIGAFKYGNFYLMSCGDQLIHIDFTYTYKVLFLGYAFNKVSMCMAHITWLYHT